MMPTFRQLEAFQAVMSAGSVTRAAEELGLGQPAVSRLIADLEAQIGFPLFLRTARTLKPTTKARELSREVERSFLGLAHVRATAERLRSSEHGALRIAVVPSLVTELSRSLIAPFAVDNPEVSIALEVYPTLDAADLLETARCDIGFTNENIEAGALLPEVVSSVPAVCVVPRGHGLARHGRAVQAKDLAGERFVSFMPSSSFRRSVDRIFRAARIDRDLRYEARTTAAACEMAVALEAVTIVPVAPPGDMDGRACVLPFRPQLRSDIVLLRHSLRALPPVAELFVRFVHEYFVTGIRSTRKQRRTASPGARRGPALRVA